MSVSRLVFSGALAACLAGATPGSAQTYERLGPGITHYTPAFSGLDWGSLVPLSEAEVAEMTELGLRCGALVSAYPAEDDPQNRTGRLMRRLTIEFGTYAGGRQRTAQQFDERVAYYAANPDVAAPPCEDDEMERFVTYGLQAFGAETVI